MADTDYAGDPGAAITRVLSAEREARLAIDGCATEAEQLLADARSRARGIVRTAERRISRLHGVCKSATEQRVRALEDGTPGQGLAALTADVTQTLLQHAVADAARALTTRDGLRDGS